MKNKISPEIQEQALKVAKGTQKPGQTKEQTKLIAQGIEKGIAEYKKQQNQKLREKDKQRKQKLKQQENHRESSTAEHQISTARASTLPWYLLVVSWLGFIVFGFISS